MAERALVAVLIALAISVRAAYYVSNPSLSVDEASLALNLMHRSFSTVFDQLDFKQAAPPGFLLLQKLVVDTVGGAPYALRLVPLVAGIVSSLLIYSVARQFIGRSAAVFALALFAVSDPLMTYASTNKQYSVDVAVALALYGVALALPSPRGARDTIVLAVAGIVAVWLSHSAAFVLAGVGTKILFDRARSDRWRETANVFAVVTAWVAGFLVAYLLTRSSVEQIQQSIAGSGDGSSLADNAESPLLQTYGGVTRYLLGIPTFGYGMRTAIAIAAMLLILVGLVVLLRTRPLFAVLLVLPGALAFCANLLDLYPDQPRAFLFVIPSLLILLAGGGWFLIGRKRPRIISVVAAGVLSVLLGTTAYATLDQLESHTKSASADAIRYLMRNGEEGDSLYVYRTAQYDFRYYVECRCLGSATEVDNTRRRWPIRPAGGHAQFAPALKSVPPHIIAGFATGKNVDDYRAEFEPLRGKSRVWILLVDANPEGRQGLEAFLARVGIKKTEFPAAKHTPSVFLYTVKRGSRSPTP